MTYTPKEIIKVIHRSQHTQRNWDLSQTIPKEDIEVFAELCLQCPSKQNIAFYNVHFIQDREMIEEIHEETYGFHTKKHPKGAESNPQTLANLLVVFEAADVEEKILTDTVQRNLQTRTFIKNKKWTDNILTSLQTDSATAVGVAAGYLNIVASLMGYETGCCGCFDEDKIQQIMCTKGKPLLLMGIGYGDKTRNRREHHIGSRYTFPTKKKQPIEMTHW